MNTNPELSRRESVTGSGSAGRGPDRRTGARSVHGRHGRLRAKGDQWPGDDRLLDTRPRYSKTYTEMAKTLTEAKKTPFQYTLNVTTLAADAVMTKLLAQAQAKTGTPDLVGVEISHFPRTMKNKIASSIFVNWTELLSQQEKSDLLRQADYAADGQTYAIESDTCPG